MDAAEHSPDAIAAKNLADMLNRWRHGEEDITAAEVWYITGIVAQLLSRSANPKVWSE